MSSVTTAARRMPGLTPRRLPTQARAQHTVDHLLSTAAVLLDEVGVDGFNTNLLAERAAVRVRTVYRYFPNKLAVITALAERMAREWDQWFDGFAALADPTRDWRALWSYYLDTFVTGMRAQPGGLAIRRAMRALPDLHAIDQEDNERLAHQVARALEQRGLAAPGMRRLAIARLLIETAVAAIDLVLTAPSPRMQPLAGELKRMHTAYLAELLDEGMATTAARRGTR